MNSPVRLGVSPVAASSPIGVFSQRFEALFPHTRTLSHSPGARHTVETHWRSVWLPRCSSWFICTQMWDNSLHQLLPCPVRNLLPYSSPCYPSPPLLQVWMNVSSLTHWLSDFHTVRFFVSSGCFLCLNSLLSFFWLCEEAQCVYLCLHLSRKSRTILITSKMKAPESYNLKTVISEGCQSFL